MPPPHTYARIAAHSELRAVELIWNAATADMPDEHFKHWLVALADAAQTHGATNLIVDARDFARAMGPDLATWRTQVVMPRSTRRACPASRSCCGRNTRPTERPSKNPGLTS